MTLDEIIKVAKKACTFDFIEELAKDFNTVIGENRLRNQEDKIKE